MKKNLLFILFLISSFFCNAQKDANIWYFGNRSGLDFKTEPPAILYNSKLKSSEGSGVIADSTGKLLFYSDGDTIWNKEHKIMENATGICCPGAKSSPSAALIVRQPLSNRYYYIFNSGQRIYPIEDVSYSVIDIEANNGDGKVIVKRRLMVKNSAEKIALVQHANKKDVWVAIKQGLSDTLFIFLLTENGISSKVLKFKSYMESQGTGQIKFSPNGKYLAFANNGSQNVDTNCYLYNFDNRSGEISNRRKIHAGSYAIEFSPNSKYLYLQYIRKQALFQCPIKNISTDFWPDSSCFQFKLHYLSAMSIQLAPNGKIYGNNTDSFLRVIHSPNLKGLKCNPVFHGQKIVSMDNFEQPFTLKYASGLPSFMASYLRPTSFIYTSRCINEPSHFLLLDSLDNDSVKWDFGDVDSKAKNYSSSQKDVSHTYTKYGSYMVNLITYYDNLADTVTEMVYFLNPNPDFIAKDICENDTVRFINKSSASAGQLCYNWKFGDGLTSTLISPNHFYTIEGISKSFNVTLVASLSNGCKDSITKLITVNANPKSNFIFNTNQNTVNFKALQSGNTSYKWFFGNGDSSITKDVIYNFPKPGKYSACLKVINAAECLSKTCKDVTVTVGISKPQPNLGFTIFPNPNDGIFEINVENPSKEINIHVYNSIGKLIASSFDTKNISDTHYSFNLKLASGIYLVRITNKYEVYCQKIVVNSK